MSSQFKLTRIPSLKTVADFLRHTEGLRMPCDAQLLPGAESPLAQPLTTPAVNGKRIGNRIAVHPMEGWDGTATGGITDPMRRRWQRFGESGAKLICGGEAMAVRADGRANPNQLIVSEENQAGLAELVGILKAAHAARYGSEDDLVIGFQLTHSGRFCRPNDKKRWESRVAYRHPLLDAKFNVTDDAQVLSDGEVEELIACFVRAAGLAWEAGADFVDIKHCHGYLLHEFLGAHTRPGRYGGSFENRTRILREIVAGIRAQGNPIDFGVRLSLFDMVPHRPAANGAADGKLGPGEPEPFAHLLPYRCGFGLNTEDPTQPDLTETIAFARLCAELGVKILNTTAGSPYYTPHIQRPAAYPPSDGYQPAYDPLEDVARQIHAVAEVRAAAGAGLVVVGSGYTYLQEYLPHVAQAVVREGMADAIGIGRMMLSYPSFLTDAVATGSVETRLICRTFSECTTAPRNGLPSGCFPLDRYYTGSAAHQALKALKRTPQAVNS